MANVNQVDGTFFQYQSQYYLVMMGQAVQIPDDGVTGPNLFGSSWTPTTFPTATSIIDPGPAFSSGACLIQATGSIRQYLYSWGVAFPIAGPPVLSTYNLNGVPFTIPATVVTPMPIGFTIQLPDEN